MIVLLMFKPLLSGFFVVWLSKGDFERSGMWYFEDRVDIWMDTWMDIAKRNAHKGWTFGWTKYLCFGRDYRGYKSLKCLVFTRFYRIGGGIIPAISIIHHPLF